MAKAERYTDEDIAAIEETLQKAGAHVTRDVTRKLCRELREERVQNAQLREALANLLEADETFRDNGPAIEEWKYVVVLAEAHDALAAVPLHTRETPTDGS